MVSKFKIKFDSKSFTLEHNLCLYLFRKMAIPIYNTLPQSQADIYYSNVRVADFSQASMSSDTCKGL